MVSGVGETRVGGHTAYNRQIQQKVIFKFSGKDSDACKQLQLCAHFGNWRYHRVQ